MIFNPRLTEPSADDKHWIHTSKGGLNSCILRTGNSVLPNCVGYSWGRAYELLGSKPKLARTNAETWYNHNDGYARGSSPKLGAIACWRKGSATNSSDGAGHVGNVEKIYEDGSFDMSMSQYNGERFIVKNIKPPYNYNNLTFQGFIYLPIDFDQAIETPEPVAKPIGFLGEKGYFELNDIHENIGKVAEFMRRVFPAYTKKEALGNKYGKNLKASLDEFKRRTGLANNGLIDEALINQLKKYGFREN